MAAGTLVLLQHKATTRWTACGNFGRQHGLGLSGLEVALQIT